MAGYTNTSYQLWGQRKPAPRRGTAPDGKRPGTFSGLASNSLPIQRPNDWRTGWKTGSVPDQQPSDPWSNLRPTGYSGMPQGWGEEWYINNAWKYDRPSSASDYWEGVKGHYNAPSSWSEDGLMSLAGEFSGPGVMDNVWGDVEQGLRRGPSNMRGAWNDFSSGMTGPTEGDRFYDANKGFFTTKGAGENWWDENKGFFSSPGSLKSNLNSLQSRYGTKGDAENFYETAMNDLMFDDGRLSDNMDRLSGSYRGANTTQRYFGTQAPNLTEMGFTERMAAGYRPEYSYSEQMLLGGEGDSGLENLYNRLFDKGSKRLDNAAAARGGYNSGAALRATQELDADLTAQHVKDRIALSGQSDQAKMARLGEARALMTAGDEAMRGRVGLGFQGSRDVDDSIIARTQAEQGLFKDVDKYKLDKTQLLGELAAKSQGFSLDRLAGEKGLLLDSDRFDLDKMTAGGDAADRAQGRAFDRMNLGFTTSRNLGNDRTQRLLHLLSGAKDLDSEERAYLNDLLSGAGGVDAERRQRGDLRRGIYRDHGTETRARHRQGFDMSRGADDAYFDSLDRARGAANDAQLLRQDRLRGNVDAISNYVQSIARTYGQGMDAARSEQFQAGLSEIEGKIRRGEISKQEAEQEIQTLLAMLNIGARASGGGL